MGKIAWCSLIYLLIINCFIINADDYTKREFSLIQPYFGKLKLQHN